MNIYDLHVHTSDVSACGEVDAAATARLYKDAGFDGIVITDHYSSSFFRDYRNCDWQDNVDMYMRGYRAAKAVGEQIGLNVFLGMELSLNNENWNDYLIYGITRDFLISHPYLCDIRLSELRKIADDNSLMIFQAHPFRCWMTVMPTNLLDGVETLNGHVMHMASNPAVEIYAELNNLKRVAGSDCHYLNNIGTAGIITENPVTTDAELVDIIRTQDFTIYQKGG